ncbi:ion transporter, partial [Mycobacterium szulgai]|nr:ion transporter [Mycobacterium szulgai]
MAKKTKEQLWEQRTEWPLALVAIVLLVMYSVQVLTRPLGEEARILWMASWAAWS